MGVDSCYSLPPQSPEKKMALGPPPAPARYEEGFRTDSIPCTATPAVVKNSCVACGNRRRASRRCHAPGAGPSRARRHWTAIQLLFYRSRISHFPAAPKPTHTLDTPECTRCGPQRARLHAPDEHPLKQLGLDVVDLSHLLHELVIALGELELSLLELVLLVADDSLVNLRGRGGGENGGEEEEEMTRGFEWRK